MMPYLYYVNMILTLLICVVILVIAVIRLNCGKRKRPRLKYILVLNASLIAAFQPYFPLYLMGLGELALSLSVLYLLFEGASPFCKYKDADFKCFDTQIFDPGVNGDCK